MNGVLAFTGSREGVTAAQGRTLHRLLRLLFGQGYRRMHNGCAIGADEVAALLARQTGYDVWGFPSDRPDQVSAAACEACVLLHPPAEPLGRNRLMVDGAILLVACPAGAEVMRSGTWSTVRYARRLGKVVWLCQPDGTLTREGGDE